MTIDLDKFNESIDNQPQFTFRRLKELNDALVNGTALVVEDIHGEEHVFDVHLKKKDSRVLPTYTSYYTMADSDIGGLKAYKKLLRAGKVGPGYLQSDEWKYGWKSERKTNHLPIFIECWMDEPKDPDGIELTRGGFEAAGEKWRRCRQRRKLLAWLRSAAESAVPFTKIVCFALGGLRQDDCDFDDCRMQHHAVVDIAKVINTVQQCEPLRGIPIFAQDPDYTDIDKKILAEAEYPITIVEDPQGFLNITEGALVVAIAPSACIRQIVADLSLEVKIGGILCITIEVEFDKKRCGDGDWGFRDHGDEGWEAWPPYPADGATDRMAEMVNGFMAYKIPKPTLKERSSAFGGNVTLYLRRAAGA